MRRTSDVIVNIAESLVKDIDAIRDRIVSIVVPSLKCGYTRRFSRKNSEDYHRTWILMNVSETLFLFYLR